MPPLRLYSLLNNLANSIVNPFVSFFTASNGITGVLLAIASSANTAFPGIIQYVLANIYVRARVLISIGTLFGGILWIFIGIFAIYNYYFVLIYTIITVCLGAANFGWLLILDKISSTQRGRTLAIYNFYASIGGLVATLITGFLVGNNLELMRYFFIIAGIIYCFNSYVIYKSDVDVSFINENGKRLFSSNPEIRKFILISFFFTLVWSMAWPIFPLAQVYKFHMDEFEVGIVNVTGGISTLALQRYVGKLVDRHRKYVMFFGRFALATFPLAYALSTSVYEIYIANLVSGFTNSASISYTAYLFDTSKYYEKRVNIALYNMFNGFAALVGSTISSLIFDFISNIFNIVLSIDIMLFTIGILRILMSLLYLKVKMTF
ncbi:MFS transporter [Sulfolobus tengchongensis]|uniref:MFS transporter n=1 Tax=Sulfolobus tengchongensis TaxID=207809 RepID=A0AAX4KYZ8_9CREN